MIVYRRRVILAYLRFLGGRANGIDLQNYLFLFSQGREHPTFDFFPSESGPLSLQLEADGKALQKRGLLDLRKDWSTLHCSAEIEENISKVEADQIARHVEKYSKLRGSKLLIFIFRAFPEMAIKCSNIQTLLTDSNFKNVEALIPDFKESKFFTIGYESKSIDRYLDILIQNSIFAVCDVRRNPTSRKFGFSRKQFNDCLQRAGITYFSFPEIGISSSERKALTSNSDRQTLFKKYERTTLKNNYQQLDKMLDVLDSYSRVAFTCFEADYHDCHRKKIAEALEKHRRYKKPVVHL